MAAIAELVVKITSDVKDAVKGVQDVEGHTAKMTTGLKSAALPAAAALAAVGAAAISAGNAAAEDAQSQALLATALTKNAGASKAAVAGVEDHIAAMSMATGVADDELRPAMATLVRSTGDVATAQSALGQALDISAATGKSVESVSTALAKAYGGQTTSLGRLVPGMDAAVLASGDMNAIMAELARTTGGSAAVAADTAAGKMKIMQVSMAEAQEEIGTALLPAMASLATALATGAQWAQKHSTAVKVLAVIVGGLAAAILAANAVLKTYEIVTGLATVANRLMGRSATTAAVGVAAEGTAATAATGATRAFGTAMAIATGPIGLTIAAVALLVAGLVLLYKKNEDFRNFVNGAWSSISGAITGAVNAVLKVIRALPGQIQAVFSGAATWLTSAGWDIIRGLGAGIDAAKSWIMGKVQAIADAIPGWMKKKLGIGSPSKETAKIGHDVMTGLAKGMDEGVAGVKAVVDKVAAMVLKTMEARFKSDKRAAKEAQAVMKATDDETDALIRNAKKREQVYADLAAARDTLTKLQDERTAYAEGITNAADAFGAITNLADKEATTADAILADMRARVAQVGKFQQLLASLTAAGLSQAAIADLAAAGVEGGMAVAEGLAEGGPAAIAEANALQAQLDASAAALGAQTASTMKDAGVAAAQGLVDGLVFDAGALETKADELAKDLKKAIQKALKKALKGGGGGGGGGNASTTLSLVPALAASTVAPAVATPAGRGRAASTAAGPGHTFNIYGAVDPEGTARQIHRILMTHDRRMGMGLAT